ncbi:MAG: hypothetical protein JWQ35_2082 [Bacteriovoracaceae bacterium]|nr:hypothetical protein [Bacteriovoracaceae bacterium]
MNALLVFIGGGIGSVLRYLVQVSLGSGRGTLLVNLVGSFLVGFLAEKFVARENVRIFLTAGIVGGFTTFSAFSLVTYKIGEISKGTVYVLASVVGSLLLCALGAYLGSRT